MARENITLRELFDEIVELAPAERQAKAAILTRDTAMQRDALELARASDVSTSRATKISAPMMGIVEGLAGPELSVGDTLGAWQLTRELGHGGMGAVYLAERRDGQFEQRAAIKLLQGFASEHALALLARERQIMANLSHPNIARLLDGGATPKGRPYLVMEYIEGVPLDAYIANHALPAKKRLQLFIEICRAVSFAHSRLVVHCDLKPSNIMVDHDGHPMLLDFGIATLIEAGVGSEQQARQAFTPRYASPELKAGLPISTATDVYSLGVMLGELIEPNDELMAIVKMAAMAEANLRYPSVALLAKDVEHYLIGMPVKAKEATPAYVLTKLVRRRWPVFVASGIAAVMLTFFVLRLNNERNNAVAAELKATRAEAVAKSEAETARRVSEFVESLFIGADPDVNGRQDVTALTLVERGKERIAKELKDQPVVQSRLYERLAIVYEKIGRPIDAAQLYDRGIEVERSIQPPQPERLSALLGFAALFKSNNKIPGDAIAQARESLALREKHDGPMSPNVAQSLDMLGLVISAEGNHIEAEPMMQRALAIRERRGGKDPDDDIGSSFHNLGVLHKRKGDFATAATYYQQAIVVKEKRWGVRHPRYLNSYEQLGDTLSQLGKYEEAEKILRASLALRRETHGENSSRVMLVMRDLASLLVASGDFVEAIPQFEKSIAIGKIASGQRAILLAPILSRLAEAHELTGAIKKADGLHKEVLSILTDTPLTDALSLAFVRHRYGKFLLNQQKADLAKPMLFEAERVRQQKLAADDPLNLQATIGVAAYMINKNEISDALARLGRVAPHIQKLHPIDRAEWFRLSAHAANATGDKVAAKDHLTASRELLQTFLKPGDKRIALAMQDIKGR